MDTKDAGYELMRRERKKNKTARTFPWAPVYLSLMLFVCLACAVVASVRYSWFSPASTVGDQVRVMPASSVGDFRIPFSTGEVTVVCEGKNRVYASSAGLVVMEDERCNG
jgi:hypothetical protein